MPHPVTSLHLGSRLTGDHFDSKGNRFTENNVGLFEKSSDNYVEAYWGNRLTGLHLFVGGNRLTWYLSWKCLGIKECGQ